MDTGSVYIWGILSMRFITAVVSLVMLLFWSSGTLNAQDSLRIQRGYQTEAPQPGGLPDLRPPLPGISTDPEQPRSSTGPAPLKGAVERRDPLVDANQFQTPFAGRADAGRLQGMADTMQMRSTLSDSPLQGAITGKSNPLRGEIPQPDLTTFKLNAQRSRLPGDLTDNELNLLKSRDIVIMQDRSSSMGEREDFPQGIFPRWYWCLSQAMDFTRQTAKVPDWLFTLVLFSSQFDVYRNVNLQQLPSIYSRNHIWIGTRLAAPMSEQLNEYFQRRAQGRARPLLIVVISDGKPQDDDELAWVIADATRQMRSPDEIHITILQVATDETSLNKVRKLVDHMHRGARYNIVSIMPFDQVTRLGLSRAMVAAIQESAIPAQPGRPYSRKR